MFQMKESKLVPSLCHGNLTLLIKLFHTKFHYFTAQQRCTTVSLETNFRFMIFFYFSEPHVTAQTTCSRNLLVQNVNNQSGLIQSSTGTDYSANMNCSWTIKSNAKLELVFVGPFEMESHYDFVYVHDGSSSSAHLIGRFSGSARPGPIVISSNQLHIRFTSDFIVQYYGFKAVY